MVHSVSGCTRGVQVKLWDPLRTHAIPERLIRVCSRQGAIQIHVYLYRYLYLSWRNWRRLWHVCVCWVSQSIIKTVFRRDWRFWYHFVPHLLHYMCTTNYQNRSCADKVIAKKYGAVYFDSQCSRSRLYTLSQKNAPLSYDDNNSFNTEILLNFPTKWCYPSHLTYVATLPRES